MFLKTLQSLWDTLPLSMALKSFYFFSDVVSTIFLAKSATSKYYVNVAFSATSVSIIHSLFFYRDVVPFCYGQYFFHIFIFLPSLVLHYYYFLYLVRVWLICYTKKLANGEFSILKSELSMCTYPILESQGIEHWFFPNLNTYQLFLDFL